MDCRPTALVSTKSWDKGWPESREDFEELVETYLDRLVLAAFRRLGNIHDAEDVVQDVFVRAYSDGPKRGISRIEPYLYRMVINASTDILRKRKRFISVPDTDEVAIIPGHVDLPDNTAAVKEVQRVRGLLEQLPQKQAEVIRLRVFDELRLSEIAAVLGCSINTVNSRLRYGFRKLRKIISRETRRGHGL